MIEVANVTKAYPSLTRGGQPLIALREMDFSLVGGQFVTMVGPSGCGKTTLLNMLAGFERPDYGEIRLHGVPVTKPGPERAVVFQQPSLLPWMSVADNIGLGLSIRGGPRQADHARVQSMVDIMGLRGFERQPPYLLSGGMQQRVAIGRALIIEPTILLMDEPFGALDAQTRGDMQRFLLSVWKTLRPTVLFVTHDVDEAILLADQVVVMTPRPGTIAEIVPISLPRPRNHDALLSRDFIDYKRHITGILRSEGANFTARTAR